MTQGSGLELLDKVPHDARIVFVGINPAIRSAQVGHYYAHPSNQFWRLLSQSALAPRPVTAVDDDWMTTQGFGFTDVAKRPTRGAGDLAQGDYVDAMQRIRAIGSRPNVRIVAFVSKTAARIYLEDPQAMVCYGPAPDVDVGGALAWFLPSTSGQSFRDTTLEEKLQEFRRLAAFLSEPEAACPSPVVGGST